MPIERSVSSFSGLAAALFALTLLACSRGEEPAYAKSPNGSGPRTTVIAVPTEPYRPVVVANAVRLSGTVLFSGTRLPDSTATPPRDQNVCGATITVPTLMLQDSALADVVVWLADIRTGRPLPSARRYELVAHKCIFS